MTIKPFTIPKPLFVEAYRLVKANREAAGVDAESLGKIFCGIILTTCMLSSSNETSSALYVTFTLQWFRMQ
jgi:hypothetical protein